MLFLPADRSLLSVSEHPVSQMSRHFRGSGAPADLGQLAMGLVILGAPVAILLAVIFAMRWWREHNATSPQGLFRELCRAHGLTMRQRRLMTKLAKAQRLPSAALLFVQVEHFQETALEGWPPKQRHQLQRLRERLFGPLLNA